MKRENCLTIKDFLKTQFTLWDQVQFRNGTEPLMRFSRSTTPWSPSEYRYMCIDEKEKIEIIIDHELLNKFHNKLKSTKDHKAWDSILDIVFDEYQNWEMRTIWAKHFITYDVETLSVLTPNLKGVDFQLGYMIESSDAQQSLDSWFKYIDKESIKKFADYLLSYEWYIVWFNTIWFDNLIVCYSAWYGEEEIAILNNKSIDLFYYLRNTTWKRMWLNKIATALVWLQKTLEWWGMQWSELLKDWLNNGNNESLKKVKEYCKWDVKMTLWVLLYLYKFWEFYIDGEQYQFNEWDLIALWKDIKKNIDKQSNNPSVMDWLFV